MNSKQLTILAVVLAVLGGLVFIRQQMEVEPDIEKEVELTQLIPDGITKSDVAKVELYNGGNLDAKVVLTRDADDPDTWRVSSHFNAPALEDNIEAFLDKIVAMKGELRARDQDDAALAKYNLTEETAFHVRGYKKDSEEPAFAVLVGKSPKPSQVFMRPVAGRDVHVADVNLRSEAGIWAEDDPSKGPEPGTWVDKQIATIEKDQINRVALKTPDKRLSFARVEKAKEPAEGEAEPAEGETPEDAATPEAAVEYEWVLQEGGPGGAHKQPGLDNLLMAFGSLSATDVVDPEKLADWGLETPAFSITLGVEGQDDVVIEGGWPNPDESGYARIAGSKEPVVYTVSKYNFERIFPKGTELFDLPALTLDQASLNRIELTQPSGNVVMEKTDDAWAVVEPAIDLKQQAATPGSIAALLAAWRASDYADAGVDSGLDAPARKVTFTAADGTAHTVELGNDSKGTAGSYARLDGGAEVLIMSKSDVDRVFQSPKDFYELTLLDIFEDDVQSIRVEREEDAFTLTRQDEAWKIEAGGETKNADDLKAEDLVFALSGFQASDILMNQEGLMGIPHATVTATMLDGTAHVFTFHAVPDDDSRYEMSYSGKPLLFAANAEDVNPLLPASADLVSAEPDVEPAAEAEADAMPESSATDTVDDVDSAATTETAPEADQASEPDAENAEEPVSEPEAAVETVEPADASAPAQTTP